MPLYQYVINKFKDHQVFIDTDSDEILEFYDGRIDVVAFKRESNLIGNEVSVCDLIKSFINRFNIKDNICQLHVTSPLLEVDTIKKAEKYLNEYDSVVSCNKIQSRFWRKENYGYTPINHNPLKLEQTQDLPIYYEENSAFYMFNSEKFLLSNSRIGNNPYFYTIQFPENVDIDTEDDWNLVNRIK